MKAPSFPQRARRLNAALDALLAQLHAAEQELGPALAALPPDALASARNLVHYVTLRRIDLRALQAELSSFGLSSLGRAEGDVAGAVTAVQDMLRRALGEATDATERPQPAAVLRERAAALFGAAQAPAAMVTMPSEAARDPALIRALLEAGMHVMRINTAHDGADAIRAMVHHLRTAERETGKRAKVLVDLAGPKLRTLPLAPALCVLKLKPTKNERGEVTARAVVELCAPRDEGEPRGNTVWVPADFLARLGEGARLGVRDARGRHRGLVVLERSGDVARCAVARTTYLAMDSDLTLDDGTSVRPLALPAAGAGIELREGDVLELSGGEEPGRAATSSAPARVSCGVPALIDALAPGQRVLFDDGKLACEVQAVGDGVASLRVVRTHGPRAILRAERGINVPDAELALMALTAEDEALLLVAAECADLVALSFVRSPADVHALYRALDAQKTPLGVILKVETQRGFEELPNILLAALERTPVGVMIARGDLAVECGFERLAEVQEEMLWLCEAAHVPVVWATQVLESLAKHGQPTRAEVTDAAMAERAECVMLNKGPYVVDALRALHDIVGRMRGHQEKKRATLRPLRSPRLGHAS